MVLMNIKTNMDITMTLGPASEDEAIIRRLLKTADRFRLNSSFLNPVSIGEKLSSLEGLFEKEGKKIPVVVDLQGAKMRLGSIKPGLYVYDSFPSELALIFTGSPDISGEPGELPVPHRELFQQCRPGDLLSLNDNRVKLEVVTVQNERIKTRVLKKGPLASFKGINRLDHPVRFDSLLPRDRHIIEACEEFDFVHYAYSFVYKGDEAFCLKEVSDRRICAKVERPESFDFLEEIFKNFDEVWLCRGDLGAQAGIYNLGKLQASFTAFLTSSGNTALLAGQVLEHMTHFPEPTRAEAVQLYDALTGGFSGIVLSDETAAGAHPGAVAEFLDGLKK